MGTRIILMLRASVWVESSEDQTSLQLVFIRNNALYRVFNKEGHKVLGCKTNKKFDFEAIKQLKASKNMGHFDNQSSFFKRWA